MADWAVFPVLLYLLDAHYLVAGTISFVVATMLNYVLSVRYVFTSGRHSKQVEIVLVYAVSAVGILINLAILGALIEFVAIHPMIAKILGTAVAFLWNFMARLCWVFND